MQDRICVNEREKGITMKLQGVEVLKVDGINHPKQQTVDTRCELKHCRQGGVGGNEYQG